MLTSDSYKKSVRLGQVSPFSQVGQVVCPVVSQVVGQVVSQVVSQFVSQVVSQVT